MKLWNHMRGLWPRWTMLPVIPFFLWTLYLAVRGQARGAALGDCGAAR